MVRGVSARAPFGIVIALSLGICARADSNAEILARQRMQYDADEPKSIFELQPFRTETQASIRGADGTAGSASLVNINPAVGAWYTLTFSVPGGVPVTYHLQTARQSGPLRLLATEEGGAAIAFGDRTVCQVWSEGSSRALLDAAHTPVPYSLLCSGELYLRNRVAGRQTSLERITDFLRDHVWGGERMIEFVKKDLYRDAFLDQGTSGALVEGAGGLQDAGPAPARVSESARGAVVPGQLGLELAMPRIELAPGRWYPVGGLSDVSFSTLAPQDISSAVLLGREKSVNPLDRIESMALVYLLAFDLQAFDVHFALGTDHPRVVWSERVPAAVRRGDLPGPDGIDSTTPLVMNGSVSPSLVPMTVATFAGGFKRSHGAFRDGALARINHGSHYGFIEEGAILSKLQPGLATVLVLNDGAVDLRTWREDDVAQLSQVRYARQNGLPLIERGPRDEGVPGEFVNLWGSGNWSGSATEDLRTVRAGLCLQEGVRGRFLIYSYFSAATPSAMARVFQAYGCRYAMHLDMNALEHTYLALYVRQGSAPAVEHLISGMEQVDRSIHGKLVPRFLASPDDRDFFYLTRKSSP